MSNAEAVALTPRQRIVDLLCQDLNSQGWNQRNKVWFVKGDVGDEWLEFVEEFEGPPENRIVDMIAKNQLQDGATGVLVSTEGWAYPEHLTASFKTEQALRAYWRLVPPPDHAERVEIRQLVLTCNDGEVIGLIYHNDKDATRTWSYLDAAATCPTGDRTIDAARGLLGLNEPMVEKVRLMAGLEPLARLAEVLEQAMTGELDNDTAMVSVFKAMPEEVRRLMLADMPDDMKAQLRRLLPEEDRKHYGL